MRAAPLLLALWLSISSAHATSLGKLSSVPHAVCAVSGKFKGTKQIRGKLAWNFEILEKAATRTCADLPSPFSVVIPSGSFSTLSGTNVYPISITEPAIGARVDLRVEYVPPLGWMLSGDDP